MYGNFYGYQTYPPTGAVPDNLAQLRTPYQPNPQPGNGLLWVQGEAGAKSFLVGPGQTALLMDSENSRFYLKSADVSGMPMPLRVFEYTEIGGKQDVIPVQSDNYITRSEFEERIGKLLERQEADGKETANE